MSEEPINLMSVKIDQVVVSDKFNNNSNKNIMIMMMMMMMMMMVLDILLVTKKVKLLSHYVLFYLK